MHRLLTHFALHILSGRGEPSRLPNVLFAWRKHIQEIHKRERKKISILYPRQKGNEREEQGRRRRRRRDVKTDQLSFSRFNDLFRIEQEKFKREREQKNLASLNKRLRLTFSFFLSFFQELFCKEHDQPRTNDRERHACV